MAALLLTLALKSGGHAILIRGLVGRDRASGRYRDGALPTSATETAWERTPWHAAQSAAWEG